MKILISNNCYLLFVSLIIEYVLDTFWSKIERNQIQNHYDARLENIAKKNSYLSRNQSWCCRRCYLVFVAFSNNKTISLSLIVKGFLYLFFMRWEGYLLCELIFFIAYSNIYCWCWFSLMLPNTQKLTEQ